MGLFQHRPEEPQEWAALPSEPLEPANPAEQLPAASIDPSAIDLAASTSVVIPVVPPASEAADVANGES